jgi:hypothetical protein
MWAAFLTGAATKATSLIEERDKEIQDDITLKINEMYKSAQETKKKAETRADKLREFASQLKALGFSDDEAVAVISSGEANTENVINLATEKAKVSPVTAEERTGLLPGGVKSMPGGIQEFIRKQTTPVVPEGATLFPRDQMRGAFGLPTDAATRTTKSLLARTGMTEEQLLGRLPEQELSSIELDLSVFSTEKTKTLAQRLDAERVALFEAEEAGNSEAADTARKRINGLVRAQQEGKEIEEGVKPPSRADYRADVNNARRTAVQELVVELGGANFVPNPQTGDLEYVGADPKARERIRLAMEERVRKYTQAFMDSAGVVPADLADTLRGFGYTVPKNNRPFGGAPPVPTPAPGETDVAPAAPGSSRLPTSRIGAGSATTVAPIPTPPTRSSGGMPQPKTDAEYNALPSGTVYLHPDGQVKTKP